eukprot:355373-Amphidinium_carterae.2
MDYIKKTHNKFQSTEITLLEISNNKTLAYHEHSNTNCSYTRRNRKHNLTRPPYRHWRKHCVQGKNRQQYHQKGGPRKQNITQIDYVFLMSDNNKHNATALTMCESTTGLGHATIQGNERRNSQSDH